MGDMLRGSLCQRLCGRAVAASRNAGAFAVYLPVPPEPAVLQPSESPLPMIDTSYPSTLLHIDGQWRHGAAGDTLAVHDPATHAEIGRVAVARQTDLDTALGHFALSPGFSHASVNSLWERARTPLFGVRVLCSNRL